MISRQSNCIYNFYVDQAGFIFFLKILIQSSEFDLFAGCLTEKQGGVAIRIYLSLTVIFVHDKLTLAVQSSDCCHWLKNICHSNSEKTSFGDHQRVVVVSSIDFLGEDVVEYKYCIKYRIELRLFIWN